MENTVISVLSTCFMVCLAFTILFFAISVILFFLFDIRTIFNVKTGRAQAKTVKEMQTANASTGRLRVGGKTQTSKLTKEQRNKTKVPTVIPPQHTGEQQLSMNSYTQQSGSAETELLHQNVEENREPAKNETFFQPADTGNIPMQFIPEAETSVLNQRQLDETKDIHFVVKKKILLIHTDEVIS